MKCTIHKKYTRNMYIFEIRSNIDIISYQQPNNLMEKTNGTNDAFDLLSHEKIHEK
jgi:ribosomal protein S2